MDRRNSIRLMLAAAIAPAFVAKGLMKVKPIEPINWDCITSQTIKMAMDKLNFHGIPGPYTCVLHPDMYEQLKQATADIDAIAGMFAIPDQYLGMDWIVHTKTITKQEALAQYPDNERLKLMIAANQVGNHNGYIKPTWENEDEV